jgi:hypothetical protein
MKTTRRFFFGLFAGAAAAAPSIVSELAKPATAAPLPQKSRRRTTRVHVDVQAIRDKNVLLQIDDYAGMPVVNFRGVPIRVT